MRMAAYLLLPTGSNLTLGDIEGWIKRARALGADESTPVELGEPPKAANQPGTVQLSIPVTVSRTILPDA